MDPLRSREGIENDPTLDKGEGRTIPTVALRTAVQKVKFSFGEIEILTMAVDIKIRRTKYLTINTTSDRLERSTLFI